MHSTVWRLRWSRAIGAFRSSLLVRAVLAAMLLTAVAVVAISVVMSYSVMTSVYESRREQIEREAEQAALTAQGLFDQSVASGTPSLDNLQTLPGSVITSVRNASATSGQIAIALLRSPDQETSVVLQNATTSDFPDVLTPELRARVASATEERRLFVQAVALSGPEGAAPGVAVGSPITIPSAGQYELYLVYDLSDSQETVSSVQQVLALGGLVLVALIVAVVVLVVRVIMAPVRMTAATSRKIAAGELGERIPVQGQDEVATLARSFNGMADSLQTQITRLADLSRMQQRFVSDVSHELRTPLTTIRLAGGVLYDQRSSFPPATARSAELLQTQIERFDALLADLLEISRYDAGAVEPETEPTNLALLAEEVAEGVRPLAEENGSELRTEPLGGFVDADVDPRRIRRILRNLLGNAIEHGEGKPIVVTIDSNEEAVAVAVRDHGVGMTPEHAAQVFDRFWRADPSRRRSIGGTGLGLAISLEDAHLHGGRIDVWSRPGQGACFRLTLPREQGLGWHVSPIPLPDDADTEKTP